MKKISKPTPLEHAAYYEHYVNLVNEHISVLDQLKNNARELVKRFQTLSEETLLTPYESGKWSLKDLLMHMIDTERVFLYRAMRFARRDRTPLPFFDENVFAKHAQADQLNTKKLLREYLATRNASLQFFNNLNAAQLKNTGIASNFTMSVRACVWIICGHELHHCRIMHERYLPEEPAILSSSQ